MRSGQLDKTCIKFDLASAGSGPGCNDRTGMNEQVCYSQSPQHMLCRLANHSYASNGQLYTQCSWRHHVRCDALKRTFYTRVRLQLSAYPRGRRHK